MSQTGLLLIRAWREEGDGSLRARISAISDVTACAVLELVTGTPTELHQALDDWITTLEPDGHCAHDCDG